MSPEPLGFSFREEKRQTGRWLRSIFPSSPHAAARGGSRRARLFPETLPRPWEHLTPTRDTAFLSGYRTALAYVPSTYVFIYRLAGIQELFLLLYLASAARQALRCCLAVLHQAGAASDGAAAVRDALGRAGSSSSAAQTATGPCPACALPDPEIVF